MHFACQLGLSMTNGQGECWRGEVILWSIPKFGRAGSDVLRAQPRVLTDPRQRPGADLLRIVEREGEVRPTHALELPMRTDLLLEVPADPQRAA